MHFYRMFQNKRELIGKYNLPGHGVWSKIEESDWVDRVGNELGKADRRVFQLYIVTICKDYSIDVFADTVWAFFPVWAFPWDHQEIRFSNDISETNH